MTEYTICAQSGGQVAELEFVIGHVYIYIYLYPKIRTIIVGFIPRNLYCPSPTSLGGPAAGYPDRVGAGSGKEAAIYDQRGVPGSAGAAQEPSLRRRVGGSDGVACIGW